MNKPSLKESFGTAQDKCKCRGLRWFFDKKCEHCGKEFLLDCSGKSMQNKDNLCKSQLNESEKTF